MTMFNTFPMHQIMPFLMRVSGHSYIFMFVQATEIDGIHFSVVIHVDNTIYTHKSTV